MTLALIALVGLQRVEDFKPIAKFDAPPLSEISGICPSNNSKDVWWVHNDSGDSARIFAVDRAGKIVGANEGTMIEGARNIDWEDIAKGDGKLYIGDVGNNGNARRDLAVYVIKEPSDVRQKSMQPLNRIQVSYPGQTQFPPATWQFDCEAIFVLHGKLHFLTKHRALGGRLPSDSTTLYRLDSERSDRTNVLTKLDQRSNLGGWVTAADVSGNGRWLAVLTQFPAASIWIFDTQANPAKPLAKPVRRVVMSNAKQCEAVCFDGPDTLIVANEQREIFRIKVNQIPILKSE